MVVSILTQRAGRFSWGATSLRRPTSGPMGLPSRVSATITSESIIPESSSAALKITR